jgi:NAD(P)H-dependent nitrite reductase small subunit
MSFEMNIDYVRICSLNDLIEQTGKRFLIEDNDIAVFRIEEEVFALSNRCPHQQAAQIFEGFIEDGCVVCPSHGWMFDIRTGKTLTGSNGLISYETKIINNEVYIKLKEKEWKW